MTSQKRLVEQLSEALETLEALELFSTRIGGERRGMSEHAGQEQFNRYSSQAACAAV